MVGTAKQVVAVEVLASPYSKIAFEPAEPLKVYDGTQRKDWGENAQGEWVEYTRFDIDKWNLQKQGNRFMITDTNGDTRVYNFVWKEIDVGGYTENKGYFEAENGDSFAVEDLIVTDDQGPDNLWQPGEEHYLQLYFKGQHISVPVQVTESPVQSVQVSVDGGSLILHENIGGHFEYNDENEPFKPAITMFIMYSELGNKGVFDSFRYKNVCELNNIDTSNALYLISNKIIVNKMNSLVDLIYPERMKEGTNHGNDYINRILLYQIDEMFK